VSEESRDEVSEPPGSAYPSKEFGKTPPPEDGSVVACPSCVSGRRRIGIFRRIACPDCLGSGVQGYGHAALRVFEEWLNDLPPKRDEASE
jgi:hypothetical protein